MPKHSLGRNESCEAVRYCIQKVLIGLWELNQEIGRTTQFFLGFWSKLCRNEQKALKGLLFFSGSIVSPTLRCVQKIGQNPNASQRVPWKGQKRCVIAFGFKDQNGPKEKSWVFLQKVVRFFPAKTLLGW